jgi:hypothetical protein
LAANSDKASSKLWGESDRCSLLPIGMSFFKWCKKCPPPCSWKTLLHHVVLELLLLLDHMIHCLVSTRHKNFSTCLSTNPSKWWDRSYIVPCTEPPYVIEMKGFVAISHVDGKVANSWSNMRFRASSFLANNGQKCSCSCCL